MSNIDDDRKVSECLNSFKGWKSWSSMSCFAWVFNQCLLPLRIDKNLFPFRYLIRQGCTKKNCAK